MSELPAAPGSEASARLWSVDAIRGLAMVLMALDHARDFFFHPIDLDPTDLKATYPALFFTRWASHICAPIFIFLAGTSVYLSMSRGKSRRAMTSFLLTRGLWLIFLELAVIRSIGWFFNFDYHYLPGWVIWVLGWSMILLAGLIHLPLKAAAGMALVLILGHNLWDDWVAPQRSAWTWLGVILHESEALMIPAQPPLWHRPIEFNAGYPLIPWVAVMALGYAVGPIFTRSRGTRRGWLLLLGLAAIAAFAALRWSQLYGEPNPWSWHASPGWTVMSFLNCTKQPPSLCFLLMTLGPALVLLAAADQPTPKPWHHILCTYGRVPLFYYLLHLPLIHGLAILASWWQMGRVQDWLYANPPGFFEREGFGFGLMGVYGVWLLVLVILYPKCRWYGRFKQKHRYAWLSYL